MGTTMGALMLTTAERSSLMAASARGTPAPEIYLRRALWDARLRSMPIIDATDGCPALY